MILAFTGTTGRQYGYSDGWEEDGSVFRYYGEGQIGDMQFVRGNAAIRDHTAIGENLYLFEADGRGFATFIGEMVCAAYDFVPKVPDLKGLLRTAIVFRLIPLHSTDDQPEGISSSDEGASRQSLGHTGAWYWTAPMDEVLAASIEQPAKTKDPKVALRNAYQRSEAVRAYVLRRAEGHCEGCGSPAPFTTPAGRPYLEPHHTQRLSDGGPDHPAWVIALCPTCHRWAHYASDASSYNQKLIKIANRLSR